MWFDLATAQFLSRHPLSAITRSPYGYTHDNPLNSTDPSGLDNYDTVTSGYSGPTTQCLAGTDTYGIILNSGESSAQACNRALPNKNAVPLDSCVGGCYGNNGMQGNGTQGTQDVPWNNSRPQSTQTPQQFQEMVNGLAISGALAVPNLFLDGTPMWVYRAEALFKLWYHFNKSKFTPYQNASASTAGC